MSVYHLNHNPMLERYRIRPGMAPGSFVALSGAWDMPARIGKCFHIWGGLDGIEPYVLAEEIRHGGRDIDFYGMIKANNRFDALKQCQVLFNDMKSWTDLVPLTSDQFGTWNVYVRDEITVKYFQSGFCTIRIPFREPIVDLSGDLPTNKPLFKTVDVGGLLLDGKGDPITIGEINYDGHGIDGVSFRDMGLIILSTDGDFNRAAPLSGESIAYAHEPYQITRTGLREINIRALIHQPDYASFKTVLKGFYTLFKKPGLRWITKKEDALRDFFVMEGFQVSEVRAYDHQVTAILNIKLAEVAAHLWWSNLSDNAGTEIITDLGNIIITK